LFQLLDFTPAIVIVLSFGETTKHPWSYWRRCSSYWQARRFKTSLCF